MQASQASPAESLFLIRVEGQNFKWVIDDTHDLSTIAGGSCLLAKVPEQVKATLDECLAAGRLRAMETIQSAASIGLFVICPASADIEQIVGAVKKTLSKEDFSHLTVSVDWIAAGSAVLSNGGGCLTIPKEALKEIDAKLVDRLMAAARFAQMRAPNVAVPAVIQDASKACCEDHVRPATNNSELGRSASVNARRKIGKEFRWTYNGVERVTKSVRKFGEMTCSEDPRHNGKIAVISIDGSGFSDIRKDYCKNAAGLKRFSEALVAAQQAFLDSLLAEWAKTQAAKVPDPKYFIQFTPTEEDDLKAGRKAGNLLRFQRLVTAGDDSIYLMPAWLAWEFLERFYQHKWDLALTDQAGKEETVSLSFRAGVVICSAKAPIHSIRELAGKLEGMIARDAVGKKLKFPKEQNDQKEQVEQNVYEIKNPVAYEILKSFDLIGSRLREYREARRSIKLKAEETILEGSTMSDTKNRLLEMSKKHSSAEIKNWKNWPSGKESNAFHLSQWRDYLDLEGGQS